MQSSFDFTSADFPALNQFIGTKNARLVYLDSAATALKPQSVLDEMIKFYQTEGGAAGRGTNTLAINASDLVENTRETVLDFCVNSGDIDSSNLHTEKSDYQCIFTNGATDSLNLIALGIEFACEKFDITSGDNIVISKAEHHANILPWQEFAKRKGLELRYLEVLETGKIDITNISNIIDERTKIISITHCSNVSGIITDVKEFMKNLSNLNLFNSSKKPIFILDSSQVVAHIPLELSALKYDLFEVDVCVFSAHKMYAPNGVGIIIANNRITDNLAVARVGGGIVELVEERSSTYVQPPHKFEAGSINVAGIVGLNAAVNFIKSVGWSKINNHNALLTTKIAELSNFKELQIIGNYFSESHLPLASFAVKGVHPHDLGQFLDERGVIVRTGHHCAQLIHRTFGIPSTTRISCGIYTKQEDIAYFVECLKDAIKFFIKA